MAASIEELTFELTTEALAEQERALSALRTRGGTVIAAASIAGSLLGSRAAGGELDAGQVLAVIAFVSCLGAAVYVLWPHKLVFAFRGSALLAETDARSVTDVAEAYRAASLWIEPNLDVNAAKIGRLSTWFSVSCGALTLEVVLWFVSITA